MRLDLLLVRLRFAKSRSIAHKWIGEGHIRLDGRRVEKPGAPVAPGAVLTLPGGMAARVIVIDALPPRRGPPAEARSHYHALDAGRVAP
jgi:ribosome-associated heat shock protein Hsp15